MAKPRKRTLPTWAVARKTVVFCTTGLLAIATLLLGYYLYLLGDVYARLPLAHLFGDSPDLSPAAIHQSKPEDMPVFLVCPGIRRPATSSGHDAALADEAEVIGVTIAGHARAYSITAMSKGPFSHVINDVLGGRSVSVAYCDRMSCARVFTADGEGADVEPLDLEVGGWLPGTGMLLTIDSVYYALKDGANLSNEKDAPLPYQRMTYVRTTWGQWRRSHPNTDVYETRPTPLASNGHPL